MVGRMARIASVVWLGIESGTIVVAHISAVDITGRQPTAENSTHLLAGPFSLFQLALVELGVLHLGVTVQVIVGAMVRIRHCFTLPKKIENSEN